MSLNNRQPEVFELYTKIDILENILEEYFNNKNYVPHSLWKLLYAAQAVCCTFRSSQAPVELPAGDSAPGLVDPPSVIAPLPEGDSLLSATLSVESNEPQSIKIEELVSVFRKRVSKEEADVLEQLYTRAIPSDTHVNLAEQIW